MNEQKKILDEFNGNPYWVITKFDIGREFFNPDYSRYLEDCLITVREKIQTIERWQNEFVVRDDNYDRGYGQALKDVLNELKK